MREASRHLLNGFELRADCKPDRDTVRYPDRFIDKRELEKRKGEVVEEIISGLGAEEPDHRNRPGQTGAYAGTGYAATNELEGRWRDPVEG
jgi:hypothetical protein